MARLDSFLRLVVEQRASDLHFHAGAPPIIRYLGDLIPIPFRSLSEEEAERFLMEIMSREQREVFARDQEVDFAYVLPTVGRFRVNVFTQSRGLGAVFRIIPAEPPTLEQARLPPTLRRFTNEGSGLVLITGPTGSGKTTTLAALVHEVNRTSARHIITIEDPVEYIHAPIRSLVTQRELGTHTRSPAQALRAALRESPDVLVVGELRDYETISLALSAAETGALVLGTLHTNSTAKAVDRLISACPEGVHGQVSSVVSVLLRGCIAQQLCKLASGEGRIAVVEVLTRSHGVSHLIRESKAYQIESYLRSGDHGDHGNEGMQSMDGCILRYVREGLITLEEGLTVAADPVAVREAAEAELASRASVMPAAPASEAVA